MATTIAQIGGFELWDILQLAQTSRMSVKLSVESSLGSGAMFFEGGNLRHAVAGENIGDEAVDAMLEWREGSVSSSQLPPDTPQTVSRSSITALLMDRARIRDEESRNPKKAPEPPPPAPVVEIRNIDLGQVKLLLQDVDDQLGGALIGSDVISKSTGMSIAGINSAPKASVLFNSLSEQLHNALTRADDAPAKGIRQFIIEGDNGIFIFVIEIDDRYRWAMMIDGARAQLGLVLAVVIPDILPRLEAALGGR
ncbi:MAG TPA: DUF4388 domain-containing protein [Nannocystaceae bacterium]|nr:DUF4388 domain-containing protein [Nannocystaceae bacterium]